MEIKDFDAVIFDMDGVLIDSEPLWKIAIIKVFGSVGIDLTIEDCSRTVGLRLDEVVAFRFRERPWTGKSQQEIIDEIMAEMMHQISTQGKPISGVLESLEYFKNQGLKIALATLIFSRTNGMHFKHAGYYSLFRICFKRRTVALWKTSSRSIHKQR